MSINWYPGHMHKARKTIINAMKHIDVLIEIVDARIPYSSQNPIIKQWREAKPTLIILSKADLANPQKTLAWQTYIEQNDNIKTLAYHKNAPQKCKQITQFCIALAGKTAQSIQPIQAMVTGIPNVGKSTLINNLAGKPIAKVGDEPAVTKQQQKIHLDAQLWGQAITLHDTPGILWPKIENPHSGYRLAILGSIKNTVMEYEDVGAYAADTLLQQYPTALQQRYAMTTLPLSDIECLEAIAMQHCAKRRGGIFNLHKAAELLVHDIRAGALGHLSLETPEMLVKEIEEVALMQAAKEAKKQRRKQRKAAK